MIQLINRRIYTERIAPFINKEHHQSAHRATPCGKKLYLETNTEPYENKHNQTA